MSLSWSIGKIDAFADSLTQIVKLFVINDSSFSHRTRSYTKLVK